jgi:hypothetical protein
MQNPLPRLRHVGVPLLTFDFRAFIARASGAISRLAISFSTGREGNIASSGSVRAARQRRRLHPHSSRRLHESGLPQHCTGTFSQGVTTVVVGQDNDGQLTLTVGRQPTYKLRPYQSRTFVIDELEGFRVEFSQTSAGNGTMSSLSPHQCAVPLFVP